MSKRLNLCFKILLISEFSNKVVFIGQAYKRCNYAVSQLLSAALTQALKERLNIVFHRQQV